MNEPDPLAQLRDIHLPEAISFWPPAPGWWLLALVSIIFLALIALLWLRRKRARIYRQEALQELDEILNSQQHFKKVQSIFRLLRQTAHTANRKKNIASLPTGSFLEFLRATSHQSLFRCDPQKLGVILYATPEQHDADYCADLCLSLASDARLWIKQHSVRGED